MISLHSLLFSVTFDWLFYFLYCIKCSYFHANFNYNSVK